MSVEYSDEWDDDEFDMMDEEGDSFVASPVAKPATKKKVASKNKENAVAAKPTKKAAAPKKAAKATAAPAEEEEEGGEAAPKKSRGKKVVDYSEVYKKLTQLEHVLLRPDTYIGSVKPEETTLWVWNEALGAMENRECSFPPGLYKIFDEILVNSADNFVRSRDDEGGMFMKKLKVTIDAAAGTVCVWNDGRGIPVVMHKEHKMYVPEMIFGELLAGSNFGDSEKRVTGGRNGLGAKLANIFSSKFVLECLDTKHGLHYKQTWENNMTKKSAPVISKKSGVMDFVSITFRPDLAKFDLDRFSDDIVSLFAKRVYDVAGCNPKLSVHLNGKKLNVRNFEDYVKLYPLDTKADGSPFTLVYGEGHERWQVAATVSTSGQFRQVSFVNSIATYEGGAHVAHVVDAITKALEPKLQSKKKGAAAVTKAYIKSHLWVFIRCLIENPSFSSQTKERMTTQVKDFGSRCKLDDSFYTKLSKGGIKDYVLRFADFRADKSLARKGGKKVDRLRGIEKLDDANKAGSKDSALCTLIVTEGDSAKTLAVCGLSVVGRDHFGVFPLRGKPLNVRGVSAKELTSNKEIQNLVKILGLQYGKKYTRETMGTLRYGKLMIMADQDVDGSHIKGLVLNLVDVHWPELLRLGFVIEFITPIVKAKKGAEAVSFYTLQQYEAWKASTPNHASWAIKYYKGLGTSERSEAREYFSDLPKHRIAFRCRGEIDHKALTLAFAKENAEQRKEWITAADERDYLDTSGGSVTVNDFINKELVHFSVESLHRAIPHVMDGMKPSQRKVLFGAFKRNLVKSIKVAQLAGYVSEKAAYHHGEASLQSTIIGMAQNFVGSNNINLLYPEGQFGSRLMGGKDASAARYIHTRLAPITRTLFHPADDALLNYLDDDGFSIEPEFYVPIIPMVLVNGAHGIGTGWSTSVPNFNPRDVVRNLKRMIRGEALEPMVPWYMGFRGEIKKLDWSKKASRNQYECLGIYEQDDTNVRITELPVGTWTQDYKDYLEKLLVDAPESKKADKSVGGKSVAKFLCTLEDYKEYHTDTNVDFTVKLVEDKVRLIETEGVTKALKLRTKLSVNNMTLFGPDGKVKVYEDELEVMRDFYTVRLEYYGKRKAHLTELLTEEWEVLDNKVRFIEAVIRDQLVVRGRAKALIMADLERQGFKRFSAKKKRASNDDMEEEAAALLAELEEDAADDASGYDYLLRLSIWMLTQEKADALRRQRDDKRGELDEVLRTSLKDMWLRDLDAFLVEYTALEEEVAGDETLTASARVLKKQQAKTKKGRGKAKAKAKAEAPKAKAKPVDVPKAKAKAATAKAKVASPKKVVELNSSFYEAGSDESDIEELDDSDLDLLAGLDDLDDLDDAPAPKKAAAKKAAPKKAAPKKRAAASTVKELEVSVSDEVSPPAARPTGRRAAARKKATYAASSSSEGEELSDMQLDDDEEDVFEEDEEDFDEGEEFEDYDE